MKHLYCEDHCKKYDGHFLSRLGLWTLAISVGVELGIEIYHHPCIRSAGWAEWEEDQFNWWGTRLLRGFCACYLHTPSLQSSAMAHQPTLSPLQRITVTHPSAPCTCGTDGHREWQAGLPEDPTHTSLWGVCNRRFLHCPQLVGKSYKVVDCLSWNGSALPHFSSLSPA